MAGTPKRKTSVLGLYILTAVFVIAGVLLFVIFYQGNGADILRDVSLQFDEAMQTQPESALDILSTPAPTPTPVPVSLTGRIIPYYENGLWGYKNTQRQVVIAPRFEEAYEFESDVAFAKENGLYGLLSINDVWLIEPCWTQVLEFSEGYAAVKLGEKWGYIDQSGKLVTDYTFRDAGSFHCGRAAVRTGSAYGYIDIFGTLAVSARWRKAGDFSEDLAFATSDEYERDRHYIIDKVGEKVATLGSQLKGTTFSEGFAVVIDHDTTYYYMNALGRSAFQTTYLDAKAFSEGLAAVKNEEGWGYINTLGSYEIAPQYFQADSFSENCAAVLDSITGKWGYINTKGEWQIKPEYDLAEPFSDEYAIAAKGDTYYLLSKDGEAYVFYTKKSADQ